MVIFKIVIQMVKLVDSQSLLVSSVGFSNTCTRFNQDVLVAIQYEAQGQRNGTI